MFRIRICVICVICGFKLRNRNVAHQQAPPRIDRERRFAQQAAGADRLELPCSSRMSVGRRLSGKPFGIKSAESV